MHEGFDLLVVLATVYGIMGGVITVIAMAVALFAKLDNEPDHCRCELRFWRCFGCYGLGLVFVGRVLGWW